MANYSAILIPGGGLTEQQTLPPWVQARFDKALELYQGEFIIPLSAGTVHKPLPRDADGFPVFEASVGAHYLMDHGIPPEKILPEIVSYDTIGNAFFSRVTHTDIRNLQKLLIITSDFHLERTKRIFEWVYSVSPAHNYILEFLGLPDSETVETEFLETRRAKEKKRLHELEKTIQTSTTLSELHTWLYTQHEAYAPGLTPQRETGVILQGY